MVVEIKSTAEIFQGVAEAYKVDNKEIDVKTQLLLLAEQKVEMKITAINLSIQNGGFTVNDQGLAKEWKDFSKGLDEFSQTLKKIDELSEKIAKAIESLSLAPITELSLKTIKALKPGADEELENLYNKSQEQLKKLKQWQATLTATREKLTKSQEGFKTKLEEMNYLISHGCVQSTFSKLKHRVFGTDPKEIPDDLLASQIQTSPTVIEPPAPVKEELPKKSFLSALLNNT